MNKVIDICKYLMLRKGRVFYGEHCERVFIHRAKKGYVSYRHVFSDGSYGPVHNVGYRWFFAHFHTVGAWVLERKNQMGKNRYYYGDTERDGYSNPTFCENIDCAKVYHHHGEAMTAATRIGRGLSPVRITEWEEE